MSFFVKDGGNFKIAMMHSDDQNNTGKTAGGVLYISRDIDNGTVTWDLGPLEWNVVLGNNAQQIAEHGTVFAFADNQHVGIFWFKDDNAGGAASAMYVQGMYLIRQ